MLTRDHRKLSETGQITPPFLSPDKQNLQQQQTIDEFSSIDETFSKSILNS